MADFNIDGKRISSLKSVDPNIDIESENHYLPVDDPSDETRKFQLKAFVTKLLNYFRLKLFPIDPAEDEGKVLTVNEGNPVWMPTASQSSSVYIFLDYAGGSDDNDGLTESTAVATLTKALTILKENRGATIFVLRGGSYNLNGADDANLLSLDSSDNKILKMDLDIVSATSLSINFRDETAGIDICKVKGNVHIKAADGYLVLRYADIDGDTLTLENTGGAVQVYYYSESGEDPKPVFRSKNITIKAYNGVFADRLQIESSDGIVKIFTEDSFIQLSYSNITCRNLDIYSNKTGYVSGSTEVYLCQSKFITITCNGELKIRCRDLYAQYGKIIADKVYIEGHYIKTPCCEVNGDFTIDCNYMVNLHGDVWSKNGSIFISAKSDYISLSTSDFRSMNNNRFLKAYGMIDIYAGYLYYDAAVLGFEASTVNIHTFAGNSSSIPDIYAANVNIEANQNIQINNIYPRGYNNHLKISCKDLSFALPSAKIAVYQYYGSWQYFLSVDIEADNFRISSGSNEVIGYTVNIKTKGLNNSTSYADLYLANAGKISAMSLNIECIRLYTYSGGTICVGANSYANTSIANLDWDDRDIPSDARFSTYIKAACARLDDTSTGTILKMCPAYYMSSGKVKSKNAGQYVVLDIGVLDYTNNAASGGKYAYPVAFISSGSNGARIPFVGNVSGSIGSIFTGNNPNRKVRLYDWDNRSILGIATSIGSSPSSDFDKTKDTGLVNLSFSHALLNEFYYAPYTYNGTVDNLDCSDMQDGLSPETAVTTPNGLINAISRTGCSGYPLKIHILKGNSCNIDVTEIINTIHPCMLEIDGGYAESATISNVTGLDAGLIIHSFRLLTVGVTNNGSSNNLYDVGGALYIDNICEALSVNGPSEKSVLFTIFSSDCLGQTAITNVTARRFTAKSSNELSYNNIYFNSGSDINLYADSVGFNKYSNYTTTSGQIIGGLNIVSNDAILDFTKFPIEYSSIKIVSNDANGYNTSYGTEIRMDGRRGFYTNSGFTVESSGYVDLKVKNSHESAFSSTISPNGLNISSERLRISETGSSYGEVVLPNFHVNFNVKEKIINDCEKVSIDYGIKRNTESQPSLVGNVYHDGSSIITPRIESPVALMNNSVIALLNGDYVVNVGMLDVCLELQSNDFYHNTTGNLVDVNATLNIGRIAKHGYIRGYHKYDSTYTDPIYFNIVANIGIVEKDTVWYSYFNDGTSGQADNDPSKHTNFKFIAHVMHEGLSSVNQSYTGANALWQVICDDKPQNVLPAAPVNNGNYILTCTMNNGTPTYSWITMNTTTVS